MGSQSMDNTWKHAVLAGLPYLLLLIWIRSLFKIALWIQYFEILPSSLPYIYLLRILFAATAIIILFYAWKQGWPIWSGSWAGIALAFTFLPFFSPSWRTMVFIVAILLLLWITLRDKKTVVLATLPLTLIVATLLYRDIGRGEYFYQSLLPLLSLIAFLIVLTKRWVWPTLAGLLLLSGINTYALMNYNSYQGQSPHLRIIPTDDGAAADFFFLSLSWQLAVVFIPLLLAKMEISRRFYFYEDH